MRGLAALGAAGVAIAAAGVSLSRLGPAGGASEPNVVRVGSWSAAEPNAGAQGVKVEPSPLPAAPEGLVLFISGNWGGHLEPCGCAERQLGGIDRRTAILQAAPAAARLLVDAGPLIAQDDRQAQLKLETFLLSMRQLGYDAIALTGRELLLLHDTLGLAGEQRPPVVATNRSESARAEFGAVAAAEKTLRRGSEELGCLVLAVCGGQEAVEGSRQERLGRVEPVAAVRAALEARGVPAEQPSGGRLVIVLLPDGEESLVKQLGELSAVDLVVTKGLLDAPELVRPQGRGPAVVTTGNLGKYVAQFEVMGKPDGSLAGARFTAVAIDALYPRDPNVVRLMDSYQMQMEMEDLIGDEGRLPRRPTPEGLQFTGNESCGAPGCHAEIYQTWKSTKHGQAMETLKKANRQYDPECVGCHSVGMRRLGGYRSMVQTPQLADVGCEACHEPGGDHADDVYAPYRTIFMPCEECHTHENSPPFAGQREEYFQKVNHWKEPRKYWK